MRKLVYLVVMVLLLGVAASAVAEEGKGGIGPGLASCCLIGVPGGQLQNAGITVPGRSWARILVIPAIIDGVNAMKGETAEEYLDVHRTWHRLGGRSTCTMLYGHVESLADRVDHLRQLRALQDETQGFVGFVPLPYQPENNDIPVQTPPTGFDALRTIAVSRIYLDNFDHITAYWVGLGMKLAQVSLSYGADDLHGTILEEHIFRMAGANPPQLRPREHATKSVPARDEVGVAIVAEMVKAIREARRTPVQRNTFYEPVKVWDGAPTATEAEPPTNKSKVLEDNLATA